MRIDLIFEKQISVEFDKIVFNSNILFYAIMMFYSQKEESQLNNSQMI